MSIPITVPAGSGPYDGSMPRKASEPGHGTVVYTAIMTNVPVATSGTIRVGGMVGDLRTIAHNGQQAIVNVRSARATRPAVSPGAIHAL